MDTTTNKSIQKAVVLLRTGKHQDAMSILIPIVKENPNIAEAWYLLGFALPDHQKQLYAFQQVLRIDPANQRAQQQIDRIKKEKTTRLEPLQSNTQKKSKSREKISIFLIGILASAFLFTTILVIVILVNKTPNIFQILSLSPEKTYSESMRPVLQELHDWLDGPVAQLIIDLTSPFSPSSEEGILYTNLDNLYYYDMWPTIMSAGGQSITEANKVQEEIRMGLKENLLPTYNAIALDGFEIITQLGGINPPDSIKIAHETVTTCVQSKVAGANAMIKFLTTGVFPETPNENCDFMDESLQKISDFIEQNR